MSQLGNWMLLVNIAKFFWYQKKTTLSINQRLKSNGTDLSEKLSFFGETKFGGKPPKPPIFGRVPPPNPLHKD
jgi:hypothetical protein